MNMHVASGPDPRRDAVVRAMLREGDLVSLSSGDVASQRPGNRAILLNRYQMVWDLCEDHIRGADSDGVAILSDYRYVDLGVKVLDRMVRLLEVTKPDPEVPSGPEVVDRDPNAVIVSASLDEMEQRALEATELQD